MYFDREISVMLGEQWKALSVEEKKVYEEQARLLADEQKKMHPDCWKRKKQVNKFDDMFFPRSGKLLKSFINRVFLDYKLHIEPNFPV